MDISKTLLTTTGMQALFVFNSVKLHLAAFSFKNLVLHQDNIPFYYMAVSYKDLELPNS